MPMCRPGSERVPGRGAEGSLVPEKLGSVGSDHRRKGVIGRLEYRLEKRGFVGFDHRRKGWRKMLEYPPEKRLGRRIEKKNSFRGSPQNRSRAATKLDVRRYQKAITGV